MFRSWRGRATIAAAATMFVLSTGAVQAAAPLQKTQAPGYYRMMLGDFEVTALIDGIFPMKPAEILKGATPAQISQLLTRSFEGETVPLSVNAFLINTGSKLVLIDSGCNELCGPGFGGVLSNLKAAGYTPEQVDEIYITHMHLDHLGGLTVGGKRAFPNAIVRADQHDADYWLNPANADVVPAEHKDAFTNAIKSINPYMEVGKFMPFSGNTELVPGIKAISAYGHTPGHTIYAIESGKAKLLLWGDLMHVAAVQFPDPAISPTFDSDSKAALVQRKAQFADAAKQGYLVGAAHLTFPGIGHLRAAGKGYEFVPVDYVPVK